MSRRSSTSTLVRDPRRWRVAIGLTLAVLVGCAATIARAETPPDDALSNAARDILATHCAPCRGKRDLASVARDPDLVRPGNPDGSPIYATMVRRLLDPQTQPAPSVEALAGLRAWIERLPPAAPVSRAAPVQSDIASETPIELQLQADRPRYKVGDEIRFTIRANVDCRLHVISIDVSGHGTVIFPNDFVPSAQIKADTDLVLPAPGAGYRFRVKEKGRERVVALCTRSAGLIDGITHDFERQRFQELGVYATFLDNALRNALKRKADGDEDATHAPLHEIWRTGIVIEVE